MRILIVEDHAELAGELAAQLSGSGFTADHAFSLHSANALLEAHDYALALLDRRLPDGDGVSLVPVIRAMHPSTRILMLTALATGQDIICGLDAGADDYLAKPYNPDELLARVRANLRRLGDHGPMIVLNNLSFDADRREARVNGELLLLQRRELELLEILAIHAGRIVLRDRLVNELFGETDDVTMNNLHALVSQLRQRLEETKGQVKIHTVRGVGYFLAKSN